MALESPAGLLSYDDYAALETDERYQVIDGELVAMPSPTVRHQDLLLRLIVAFSNYLQDHPCGKVAMAPLDVVFRSERPAQVVQPDIMYISNERKSIITAPNLQGAPDLVVEILSPGTAKLDLTRKKQLYADYGVTEYWIVWPDVDRVETYRRTPAGQFGQPHMVEGDDALVTPLLPDFGLRLSELFATQ